MTKTVIKTGLAAIVFCSAAAVLGGCADLPAPSTILRPATTPQTAQAGDPRVQECAPIGGNKFVCGGKVYTSFQLAKLREEETKKYESGR